MLFWKRKMEKFNPSLIPIINLLQYYKGNNYRYTKSLPDSVTWKDVRERIEFLLESE